MKKFIITLIAIVGVTVIALVFILEDNCAKPIEPIVVSSGTSLQIRNGYDSCVTVYVTLGDVEGCVQNVLDIPFVTDTVPGQKGMQGTFTLQSHTSTKEFNSGELGFNGVISFMYAPDNCASINYMNGLNQFEFMLNNTFQPGNPQESIDISCVHGVNCVIHVSILDTMYFNAGPLFPKVSDFENSLDRNAIGMPGVYPYGCDTCTMWKSPPSCIVLPQIPQKEKICQIQRNASSKGGLIVVTYMGQAQPLK